MVQNCLMSEDAHESAFPSGNEEPSKVYHDLDIINTQIHEQWEEGNFAAEKASTELIKEVDEFLELADDELSSPEEYARLLQKLDAAIAIYNEPYARELRRRLLERYGN